MKDPWDWDEADINQLIQGPVQESVSLDYKACASLDSSDVKKNEVSKDVSAFANSAGGTIVYGVIEQGNVPTGIDSGYDPAIISREWLEQVINTRIQRRIDGVRIKQVLLTGQRTGKVLYVVSVPQNMGFPYQASDKRFYKRFNFQSVPMEVYEIQDVARRAEVPDLQISLNFSSGKSTSLAFPGAEHWSSEVRLTAELENANPAPAEYIWLTLYVDRHITVGNFDGVSQRDNRLAVHNSNRYRVTVYDRYWAIPNYPPIWQGASSRVLSPTLGVSFRQTTSDYIVGWIVRTPRMSERKGAVTIHVDHFSDVAVIRDYNYPINLEKSE